MRHQSTYLGLASLTLFVVAGCASVQYDSNFAYQPPAEEKKDGPKKLLAWEVGSEKKEDAKDDDQKKNGNGKNGDDKNGNGNGDAKPPERDIIATDRPDFTEASSAVGKGRVQLEAGYTYTRDSNAGETTYAHSYPEALLRFGLFAEWFEFRIGQNLGSEHTPSKAASVHGASDLYLGCRFDLTEQKGAFPESSLVLQSTVPSGHRSFSAKQMLPGFNLLYGWDVIEDRLTFAGSTQINRRIDEDQHFYAEYAQALTMGFRWSKRLGQYTEWFALIPCGANASDAATQHYLDGGFTYLITDNFQLDIRAGVGLNRAANDFFAGSGFGIRF